MSPPLRAARAGVLVHADGSVLHDAGIAWRGDRIVAAGPWRALGKAVDGAPCEGGRGFVLVPGLVNAHQHGHGLTSLAGGVADQPLEGWLAEGLGLPVPSDRASVLVSAARLIRSGVTTCVHLHACRRPADPERMGARIDAYVESGLNAGFASGFKSRRRFALVDDDEFLSSIDAGLRDELLARFGPAPDLDYLPGSDWEDAVRALHRKLAPLGDRVRLLAGPAGPEWSHAQDLDRVARVAGDLGLAVQVHVAESPLQARHARVAEAAGRTAGLASLERAGLLGPATSLVHVVHATSSELDRIAASGAMVVTCPASNLRLRHGVAPVGEMRGRGIEVALGTDSIALDDRDDLFTEARLLLALHGGGLAPSHRLEAKDAWAAMTTAGARACGTPEAGRLEPGARADFVLLDARPLTHPAAQWLGDPATLVLQRARPEDVRLVVAGGRELLRDGRILTFDEDAVAEEAADAVARAARDPASADLARRLAAAVSSVHATRYPGTP